LDQDRKVEVCPSHPHLLSTRKLPTLSELSAFAGQKLKLYSSVTSRCCWALPNWSSKKRSCSVSTKWQVSRATAFTPYKFAVSSIFSILHGTSVLNLLFALPSSPPSTLGLLYCSAEWLPPSTPSRGVMTRFVLGGSLLLSYVASREFLVLAK